MICAYIQKISIPASYYELNKIKFSINWPSRHKQSILSVGSTAAIYRSAVNCATHTAPYMHNTSTQSSGICVLLLLLLHHSPSCSQRESPIVRTTQPYRIYIYIRVWPLWWLTCEMRSALPAHSRILVCHSVMAAQSFLLACDMRVCVRVMTFSYLQ